MHSSFLVLRVKARLCVGEVFAGQDDLLFHNHGLAVAVHEAFCAKWHGAIAKLCAAGFGAVVHHADFKRGRTAQNVFGLGGVLHAWQLHHDAVCALLLNHRLGHAQLVDTVVQGGDVLLDGLLVHALGGHGVDHRSEFEVSAIRCAGGLQVQELVLNHTLRSFQRGHVAKANFNGLVITADATVAHVLFAQAGADVTSQ